MAGPTNESFFEKLLAKPHHEGSEIHKFNDYSNIPEQDWQELPVGGLHPFAIIKYKGVFDMTRLYKVIVRWSKSRKFMFHEKLYRFKPPELILNWQIERKKTAFIKDIITVVIDIRGFEEVETIVGGVRKKMTKGRLTIYLNFGLETGYADLTGQRKWKSAFERHLRNFMHRFVIKRDFELLHLDALMYESWKLHKVIKDYLNLECRGSLY